MKRNLFLLIVLICSVCAYSQSKLSNYTRSFLLDNEAREMRCEAQSVDNESQNMISAFVHFNESIDLALLDKYGVVIESEFETLNLVTATIPVNQLETLAQENAIRYIEMATPLYPQLDVAHKETGMNLVHAGTDQSTRPFLGKNVIVGIVDYGFQYTHPAFFNADGSASRIERVWEQETSMGTRPTKFSYGKEYKFYAELAKQKYDSQVDNIGHGTHVAGIAVGSNNQYSCGFSGVAPESRIVLVSYRMQQVSTSLANAVEYIFDYADELGCPAVVNMSLGQQTGPHDGTSTLDMVLDELQGEGRIICGAVGNDAKRKIHIMKEFSDSDTLVKSFADFYYKSPRQVTIDMWGEFNKNFELKALVYDAKNDTMLYQSDYFSTAEEVGKSFFGLVKSEDGKTNVVNVKFTITTEINPLNQKPHIMFIPNVLALPGDSVYVGFELKAQDGGIVHAWADGSTGGLTNEGLEGWLDGDNRYTVNEIGGTGKRIISVGAYTTREHDKFKQTLGERCTFSNIGPTVDGRLKPQILAPGSAIVSSVSNSSKVMGTSMFIEEQSIKFNDETHYYGYMDGTSMSTPYVTGVVATLLEHKWELTPEEVADILTKTARSDEFTGVDLPNNEMGYGKIDAYKALLKVLELYTGVENVERAGAMILYPNPTSRAFNVGFVRESDDVKVMVYDVNGQLIKSERVGAVMPGMDCEFNLDGVANGAYIVKVSGENLSETFRLLVVK